MKLTKCLIFRINDQKFAIKTSSVLNIIEKARMVDVESGSDFYKSAIVFRGMTLPLLDMREILGMQSSEKQINECVLIAEVKLNEKLQIIGVAIDEVVEVAEIDDFMAYPYMPVVSGQNCDFREAVILRKGEPVIIINAGKLHYKYLAHSNITLKTPVIAN